MNIDKNFINNLKDFSKTLSKEIVKIQNSSFSASDKKDGTPLTEADLLSNEEINLFLKKHSSCLNIISEENKQIEYEERKDWEYYWVIDPLDGTKEFIKGNEDYCVNIALCRHENPIFGCVIQPTTQDFYFTFDGGSYKNFNLINCSEPRRADKLLKVVASSSHINEDTQNFIDSLKEYGEVELVNIGSALKFCKIATGEAHIYPRVGPTMEWDTCAPHALINFSGGFVFKYKEIQELVYNKKDLLNPNFVAASFTSF